MNGYGGQRESVAACRLACELLRVAGTAGVRSQIRFRGVVEDVQGLREQWKRCRHEPR